MISALKGRIFASAPGRVDLETGGGLIIQLIVPVSSFSRLQPGQEALFQTVLKIKDEDVHVYGFLDAREKAIFEKLLQVTGVGGKIAMACISGFSADELSAAIEQKDVERISSVPGIGRKTAQRMILELTGKLDFAAAGGEAQKLRDDLTSALVNLGYPPRAVREAVSRTQKEHPETAAFEPLFRLLLRKLSG